MISVPSIAEDGGAVFVVTDIHAGKRARGSANQIIEMTPYNHMKMGRDMDNISQWADAMALAGDLIDWAVPEPEDDLFSSWFNARANKGKYVVCSGNHDLGSHASPYPARSGDEWSSATGFERAVTHDVDGNIQIVAISQESMAFNEWIVPERAATDSRPEVKPGRGFDVPQSTLNYLEAALQTGKPTWLMMHYSFREQNSTIDVNLQCNEKLVDILTRYTNVIGVLSGHRHCNPFTDANSFVPVTITGNGITKTIAGVNCPSSGGQMAGTSEYPWDNRFIGTLAQYKDGVVTVRWRDMIQQQWLRCRGTYSVKIETDCTA